MRRSTTTHRQGKADGGGGGSPRSERSEDHGDRYASFMPKRSNVFQETVAVIQTHFSGEATVTESCILTDRLTGQEREVDVVVEGALGMNPVIVGIEATAKGRPATVEWVEQLIEKHRHLPTDRLVLVSESGFTASALKLALAKGVSAVYPQELTSDEADRTVAAALGSLMARQIVTRQFNAELLVDDAGQQVTMSPLPTDSISDATGNVVGTVSDLVNATMQASSDELNGDLGRLPDGTTGGEVVSDFGDGLFIGAADGRLLPVVRIRYYLQAEVRSEPVALTPRGLAGVIFSSGTARFGDDEVLLVMTEKEGRTRVTIRERPN
jgi:hypothetical protein